MKTKFLSILALSFLLSFSSSVMAQLDSDSAIVRLNVAKYAQVTGLDDFILNPISSDGAAESEYSGFDMFNLESNTAVSVSLSGEQLSNVGGDTIVTEYALDDGGMSFDTIPGIHNDEHKVSAEATLGQISDQEAGDYSAQIVITVAAL
jgi:hypothetical protein